MTPHPIVAPARPNALFLAILQFVALLSLLPWIVSYTLYGFGQMVAMPYYFALDGKGGYTTLSEQVVFALPRSFTLDQLVVAEVMFFLAVVVIAWGLWIYAAISPAHRRHLVEMAFALALPTFAVFVVAVVHFFPAAKDVTNATTLLLPKFTLLWFGLRGRFFSWSTLLFLVMAIALPVAATPEGKLQDFSQVADSIFVFFLAASFLRLVSIAIGANVFFFNKLGTRATLLYLGRTARLWIPMFLLSAPYFITEHAAEVHLNRALRATGPAFIVAHFQGVDTLTKLDTDSPQDSRAIVEMTAARQLRLKFAEFQESMRQQQQDLVNLVKNGQTTLDVNVATEQAKAIGSVATSEANSLSQISSLQSFSMADATRNAFASSFNKPLDLPASNSGIPVVGSAIDLGVDLADANIQKGYTAITGEMENFVTTQAAQMDQQNTLITGVLTGIVTDASGTAYGAINSGAGTAYNAINSGAGMTEKTIAASFDFTINSVSCQLFKVSTDSTPCPTAVSLDVSRNAQLDIWYIFAFLHGFQMFTQFLFGLVCVKSFLYVFSRVAFNHDAGAFLTLGQLEGTPILPEAQITRFPSRFVLHPPGPAVYYVSRKFQGRGRPPRFALPQPFHAPIARLIHGAMTMNKVEFKPGDGPVSYTARFGSEFVVWDLQPGEEIVFNFHSFVAMSDTVKISTLISARLSALVLGEIIFSTATGPGQIVFLTAGRAEVTNRDETGDSLPPDRFVAMHRDARLNVESELGVVDVYISDAYVRPTGHGQVIVDVDKQGGGGIGLIRFLKHFLWPG
jgi:hypothetical protein